LLDAIPDTVSECTCITRWLPEDIASGVCDLEIFDDIAQVNSGRLLVHPHLHAKYYSNGQQSLIGSANLTARGLGWYTPSNVELLVALPADFTGLTEWEESLLDSAVEATKQLREQIHTQAEEIKKNRTLSYAPEVEYEAGLEEDTALWVPQCPVPERLWEVYCGVSDDTMPSNTFKAAQEDLSSLSPPPGLTQDIFTVYVAGILKHMPLLTEIDKLALAGLTDTKAHEFLSDRLGSASGESEIWEVVKRWLIHFFRDSYRLETSQEVLVKGRKISY